MWIILVSMLVVVLLAAAVIVYVAYPHRGERLPVLPMLGDLMRRGVDSLPTLQGQGDRARRQRTGGRPAASRR